MIDWRDHIANASWYDNESIKKEQPITARTVGYLAEETDEYYKLVDTITNDDGAGS